MKKSIFTLLLILAAIATPHRSEAQVRFGPHASAAFTTLSLNNDFLHSKSRTGFNVGLQFECMIPNSDFGFDFAFMYLNRREYIYADKPDMGITMPPDNDVTISKDYLNIPLHFRYKFSWIPEMSRYVIPYLYTGPNLQFMMPHKDITSLYYYESVQPGWDFGLGFEVARHIQVSVYYVLGLTNHVRQNLDYIDKSVPYKVRYNTLGISAAWMF